MSNSEKIKEDYELIKKKFKRIGKDYHSLANALFRRNKIDYFKKMNELESNLQGLDILVFYLVETALNTIELQEKEKEKEKQIENENKIGNFSGLKYNDKECKNG